MSIGEFKWPAVVYAIGGDRLGAWTLQHVYGPVLVEYLLMERRGLGAKLDEGS